MHLDWSISLGNILTVVALVVAIIKFWGAQVETKKDLEWRISNLEVWRKEHMIDADARDQIIERLDRLLIRVEDFIGIRDQRKLGTIRTRKGD